MKYSVIALLALFIPFSANSEERLPDGLTQEEITNPPPISLLSSVMTVSRVTPDGRLIAGDMIIDPVAGFYAEDEMGNNRTGSIRKGSQIKIYIGDKWTKDNAIVVERAILIKE